MNARSTARRFPASRAALVAVFLVALVARASYVIGFELTEMRTGFNYMGDEESYDWMAENLLEHGSLGYRGEPSARRGPGYPLFLAGVYSLFGRDFRVVRWLQIAIDAGAALLLALTLRRLGEPTAGLFSGLAYGLYPIFIYNAAEIMTEALILPLTVAVIYLLVCCLSSAARLWLGLLAGLLVGALFLVRENNVLLPLPLALLMYLGLRYHGRPHALATAGLLLAGFGLLWTPWVARNWLVFGQFSFGGTTGGEALLRSINMADSHGRAHDRDWDTLRRDNDLVVYREYHDPARRGERFPDEWESDKKAKRMAWERIQASPETFLRFGFQKLAMLALYEDPHGDDANQTQLRQGLAWIYSALALVGLIGAVLAWRRGHRFLVLAHGVVVGTAAFVVFLCVPFIRYRYVSWDLALVAACGFTFAAILRARGGAEEPPKPRMRDGERTGLHLDPSQGRSARAGNPT